MTRPDNAIAIIGAVTRGSKDALKKKIIHFYTPRERYFGRYTGNSKDGLLI